MKAARWIIAMALLPVAVWARAPHELMQDMAGTWDVQQRMWVGAGAPATPLPPAIAQRELVDGHYVVEVMKPRDAEGAPPFQRHALFVHNPVTQRFEYASLDTRAPQLMVESSAPTHTSHRIDLNGGSFVAPKWGDRTQVAFRYRLEMDDVENGRQNVRLYLTPQKVRSPKEFLAFEYTYVKRR